MTSLLFAGCGTASTAERARAQPSEQSAPTESVARDRRADLTETTTIEGCRITTVDVDYWRDWLPIVRDEGPDGGSPLITLLRFRFENGSERALTFRPAGAVRDEDGTEHPISFDARRAVGAQDEWDGVIGPSETREIEVVSDDGPDLPVGGTVRAVITWRTDGGEGTVIADREPIDRTS